MVSDEQIKRRVAVIGSGISGLAAAKRLREKGYEVDIYDSSPRAGGKIGSVRMQDGQVADLGAEFIDSDQASLIDLCKELNVPLIPTMDEGSLTVRFNLSNGKTVNSEEFAKLYRPIADQIIADKKLIAADPAGARAQHLDRLSLAQYMQEISSNAGSVNPEIAEIIEKAVAGERGRRSQDLSALQHVHDASSTPEDFISSDCMYRVQGGTGQLIEALREDLQRQGVHFHFNNKVTGIGKVNGSFQLVSANEASPSAPYDQIVLATTAHALPNIAGLSALGFTAESLDTLQQAQYTHNSKLTIKTKVPVKNDGFFISHNGYQAWNRAPGEVVFLIGDDLPNRFKPSELMQYVLNDYAKAHGTTADQFFDATQVNFNGPNTQNPCYISPAPGQTLKLHRMADTFDTLAQQGIGVVGTYIPQHHAGNRVCGYMGNGVESVNRAVELMSTPEQVKEQATPQITITLTQNAEAPQPDAPAPLSAGQPRNTPPVPPIGPWTLHVQQGRATPPPASRTL